MSWKSVHCDECEKQNFVMVILTDDLWKSICKTRREHLCLACMEGRLGRPITFDDLRDNQVRDDMLMAILIANQTYGGVTIHEDFKDTH